MGQQSAEMKTFPVQGLWFCFTGSAAAATHFICLMALVDYVDLTPQLANPIAFIFAFLVSFLGHFRFTFRQISQNLLTTLWRWLFTSILGFLLNQLFFLLGLKLFGSEAYGVIWFVVTIIVTILTFILAKFWAFRSKEKNETSNHFSSN